MSDKCSFSTYGYACGKPVEHGHYLCEEHIKSICASCGKPATHGCDYCGQFVCGTPLCDECTYSTDKSKQSGAWGFMNHIHVSKPEFADKHKVVKLEAEIAKLREALSEIATTEEYRGLTAEEAMKVAQDALSGGAA